MMKIGPWEVGPWEAVGFIGQALFFARFYIQWIVSEKKRESVVPVSFWFCSLAGSLLVLYYSISIHDPVFIVGMAIGFLIAVRNLVLIYRVRVYKNPIALLAGAVIVALTWPAYRFGVPAARGPLWFGFLGQGIFTARFVIQWIVSEKKNKSVMPVSFWYCSLVGGGIRLGYALYIGSLVFILGNGVGLIPYVRNLMLISRNKRTRQPADGKIATPETAESKRTS